MSTAEKIGHLEIIKEALIERLKVIQSGEKIKDFDFMSPREFEAVHGPSNKIPFDQTQKYARLQNKLSRVAKKPENCPPKPDPSEEDQIEARQPR